MTKIFRTLIILLAAALLAGILPWLYAYVSASPSRSPFTLYSCVVHSFASLKFDENGDSYGEHFNGVRYTLFQMDSILPMFYYRQLVSERRFPSNIEGIPVTPKDAEKSGFIFRSNPSEVNAPSWGLYRLLESESGRVDFKPSVDVFRINDYGIEFVGIESNELDSDKSRLFTEALDSVGFSFPARIVAGNGSPKKEYDNGYLIYDSLGRLFQLKQVKGKPYVREIVLPEGMKVDHIFVTEFRDRRMLGFLSCTDGSFYAVEAVDGGLHEVPIGGYDPKSESIMIIGDMFYWTVSLRSLTDERLIAVNSRSWEKVDEHGTVDECPGWEKASGYIFPFTIFMQSPLDSFIMPRFDDFSAKALWVGLLLAALYAVWATYRDRCPGRIGLGWRLIAFRSVAVLLLGVYLFIPLLIADFLCRE